MIAQNKELLETAIVNSRSVDKINESIDGINTAVDESAHGVTMVADSASQLVEMLGNIRNDAESNRAISDELSNEVAQFDCTIDRDKIVR